MSTAATPFDVFRSGRHVSAAGEEIEFTEAEVAAIAEAYDPARYEAPLVIGHPATDAPAYGWVASLRNEDGTLRAVPRKVDPAFAEKVRAGRYRRVSAAFYRPDHRDNPRPGVFYLKHVGFLGAAAPAVKGLRPVEFVSDSDGVIEFSMAMHVRSTGAIARLFGGVREFMIAQFGAERADAHLPAWEIDLLREAAAAESVAASEMAPSAPVSYEESKPMPDAPAASDAAAQTAFAEREAAIAERERRLAEREASARRTDDEAFVDKLVTGGRLLPAQRAATLSFMAALDANEAVQFAEGDAATPHARFRELLSASPRVVEFREIASGDVPESDEDPRAISRKADDLVERERAAGRSITHAQAVQAVMKGGAL